MIHDQIQPQNYLGIQQSLVVVNIKCVHIGFIKKVCSVELLQKVYIPSKDFYIKYTLYPFIVIELTFNSHDTNWSFSAYNR